MFVLCDRDSVNMSQQVLLHLYGPFFSDSFSAVGDGDARQQAYVFRCRCVHRTAVSLDGVAELPDTQKSRQTDANETH